jgi:hypothetical protein
MMSRPGRSPVEWRSNSYIRTREKKMSQQVWKTINWVLLLAFTFGAIVQYNDPDPLAWILVYLGAGIATVLALLGSPRWEVAALVGAGSILWGLSIAPRVIGQVPFMSMFGAFEMKNIGIEESREMYGLFIIGGWCVLLTLAALRQRRQAIAT